VNRKHVIHQLRRVCELQAVARVASPVRHLERSPWKLRGDQRFTVARPISAELRCAVPVLDLLRTMSFAARARLPVDQGEADVLRWIAECQPGEHLSGPGGLAAVGLPGR
jgi:hypothetical protein